MLVATVTRSKVFESTLLLPPNLSISSSGCSLHVRTSYAVIHPSNRCCAHGQRSESHAEQPDIQWRITRQRTELLPEDREKLIKAPIPSFIFSLVCYKPAFLLSHNEVIHHLPRCPRASAPGLCCSNHSCYQEEFGTSQDRLLHCVCGHHSLGHLPAWLMSPTREPESSRPARAQIHI